MYFAKKKKKKGFTLIELLVVIAIIGILATIVVVNVNSARNKAKDTVIIGTMDSLRNAAEMWYSGGGGNDYTGICTAAAAISSLHETNQDGDFERIEVAVTAQNAEPECYETATGDAYAVWADLVVATGWFCVDCRGVAVTVTTEPTVSTCD